MKKKKTKESFIQELRNLLEKYEAEINISEKGNSFLPTHFIEIYIPGIGFFEIEST